MKRSRNSYNQGDGSRQWGTVGLGLMFIGSGAFNICLVVVFLYFSGLIGLPKQLGTETTLIAGSSEEPPVSGSALTEGKSDYVANITPSIELRSQKTSLTVSVVTYSPPEQVLVTESAGEASTDSGEYASLPTEYAEETSALSVPPILATGTGKSLPEILTFKTVNISDGATECVGLAKEMLRSAGASQANMKIVAQSEVITIARICAANGSVVMTCRGDTATVSPRRSRPDDACGPKM